jgi:ABC-type glutathione transport system ATPase component
VVVRYLADGTVVLYLGRVMEIGDAETSAPNHPVRPRIRVEGEIPSHADPRSEACSTRAVRASSATSASTTSRPQREVEPEHFWRRHHDIEAPRELQKTAPPPRRDTVVEAGADAGSGLHEPDTNTAQRLAG